jgi:hypothetical protein
MTTIDDFLAKGNMVTDKEVTCLCSAAKGIKPFPFNNICNWMDADDNWWAVEVLDDGTAVTWCMT